MVTGSASGGRVVGYLWVSAHCMGWFDECGVGGCEMQLCVSLRRTLKRLYVAR